VFLESEKGREKKGVFPRQFGRLWPDLGGRASRGKGKAHLHRSKSLRREKNPFIPTPLGGEEKKERHAQKTRAPIRS